MIYLDRINDAGKQSYTIVGENNEQIPFYLWYAPSQETWFFDISYGDFSLRGAQLTVSPNLLRAYKNLIPFGLSCTSIDGLDPFYISDFVVGRISLYLLNEAEVQQVEDNFFRATT